MKNAQRYTIYFIWANLFPKFAWISKHTNIRPEHDQPSVQGGCLIDFGLKSAAKIQTIFYLTNILIFFLH